MFPLGTRRHSTISSTSTSSSGTTSTWPAGGGDGVAERGRGEAKSRPAGLLLFYSDEIGWCINVAIQVTEAQVSDCDLSPHVGQEIAFDISIRGGAMLYTIGFSD